jgi:Na+/H+ antiporter NhaD/arsenite permease-like protein
MRFEDKRRHAEAIARLAALANTTVFSTVVSSVPSTFAMAQIVKVSPTEFLGKSTAINLVAKETSSQLSVASPYVEEYQ